jgi:hypothetical protein
MNFTRTATILVVGAVLIAWLASAATSKREFQPPIITPPQAIDARGVELTKEIARLHERLRPTTPPADPRRNLFTFRARTAPAAARPDTASLLPATLEASTQRVSEPPLKLAGIAEDDGADGPDRTAIISGGGQLFMVKEGDTVAGRYRVARISTDAVELTDVNAGIVRRLVMK